MIHAISRWSGKESDETPLCGLDKSSAGAAANRTIYHWTVDCPECRQKLEADECKHGISAPSCDLHGYGRKA